MATITRLSADTVAAELVRVRAAGPLVHCLTNSVVTQFTANVLLALGASPAMVVAAEEVGEFARIASALSVNVGTLDAPQRDAIRLAVAAANAAGTPWTLDPVAAGALAWRTGFCRELLALHPVAIRGNASEILSLAGVAAAGRGVDSTAGSDAAIEATQSLARQTGAIVAVTGEIDYVSDGERVLAVPFGHPLMTRVVGTGCALSSVVAAFTAGAADRLTAVAAACAVMAVAGEIAVAASRGPGSFEPAFLDALYRMDAAQLAEAMA